MKDRVKNPVFCALDTSDLSEALRWSDSVKKSVGGVKLGLEFFSKYGPDGVLKISESSKLPIFLDLKFNDIPNTVSKALKTITSVAPYMVNVHANGGVKMMRAACEAALEGADLHSVTRPLVLGVTFLTSLDKSDLLDFGIDTGVRDYVIRLAVLARDSGLDGVVCSPLEVEQIRSECGEDFVLVTPGVRPVGFGVSDQKRITTPVEALSKGADYLVIGRPITSASNPAAAAEEIASTISLSII